jgi:DASS family divalent anion:Na+ symporter
MIAQLNATLSNIKNTMPFRWLPALLTSTVLLFLLQTPSPQGLEPKAWGLVVIFLTTIVGIILKVMPIGVMSIVAILAVALTQVTASTSKGALSDALASFSNPLIWLIVVSILISHSLKKTGLGQRIGLMFIAMLGKRTIGIGYGLTLCELVLSPFTPSNTARGGGIVFPITKAISNAFDSDPTKGTQNKVGSYLSLVNYQANVITSVMFVTATAPNPLVIDMIAKATGQAVSLSWTTWALCMLLPGLLCLLAMPLIIYLMAPPELKATPNAVTYAREELNKMGPLSNGEKITLSTFTLLLMLWANVPAMLFGPSFALETAVVAFIGLFVLIFAGILNWDDILAQKSAWDTLIWFAALIMLAEQLNKTGVVAWFSAGIKTGIVASGMNWLEAATILVVVFVFSHYFFASSTAHISSMFLAFITVGANLIPPEYIAPFMLMMAAGSSIMMALTHYATGTSPIIFGSGYVGLGRWWSVGLIMCWVDLLIFAFVGAPWWKMLGMW